CWWFFFFQGEDGIRDATVTGVQTCALPILGAEEDLGFLACAYRAHDLRREARGEDRRDPVLVSGFLELEPPRSDPPADAGVEVRSEERRVGKEVRSQRCPWYEKQTEETRHT